MRTGDLNPALYRQFEDGLLDRVSIASPRAVYDLGCGPGYSTELLVERVRWSGWTARRR